jgi:Zn-dependent M28 family amino/carboxypeptidase
MKNILLAPLLLLICCRLCAQDIGKIINPAAVENIEKVLSADNMRGRACFTPDIERAADYIETQFKAAGLQTWNGSSSYRQPFSLVRAKTLSVTGNLDGNLLPAGTIAAFSPEQHLSITEKSGYEKVFIKAGAPFMKEAYKYIISQDHKSYLILVDTSFRKSFEGLMDMEGNQQFKSGRSIVFVLTTSDPVHYSIGLEQEVTESKLANVAGILPGKSKKNEYVIFSGHYDHLGVGTPDSKGDSIFNGANDDASGTTAVLMLAKYFGKLHSNERTLVFATFTAEEIGEYGSQYFSRQFDPAAVMAMFNIEMIGTESKWGINSAYITGYERTDMGKILEKNLSGSLFTFYPDPYPQQQLFYRSDNATLARQGVPAHTISTSKMDSEKYYHTQGDEIGTLDMNNMARIIKSIALSSRTIIAGTDTPSRVDATQMR